MPLSDDGKRMARESGDFFARSSGAGWCVEFDIPIFVCCRFEGKIKHVFTSPLLRCIETADPVAAKLSLDVKLEDGKLMLNCYVLSRAIIFTAVMIEGLCEAPYTAAGKDGFAGGWTEYLTTDLKRERGAYFPRIDRSYHNVVEADDVSFIGYIDRLMKTVDTLLERHPGEDLVLVTHGTAP
jgi:broad specificity phosphatase PhoE